MKKFTVHLYICLHNSLSSSLHATFVIQPILRRVYLHLSPVYNIYKKDSCPFWPSPKSQKETSPFFSEHTTLSCCFDNSHLMTFVKTVIFSFVENLTRTYLGHGISDTLVTTEFAVERDQPVDPQIQSLVPQQDSARASKQEATQQNIWQGKKRYCRITLYIC